MRRADRRRRELAREVRSWSVEDLLSRFVEQGVERAFVTFENGEFTLSHPQLLEPVRAFFELSHDFARHEGVFIGREGDVPTLFFAFVHDTRRGLSQGGLRFKPYGNMAEVLADGLRLSQGMTRKNALAGLWWGGGKGIVPFTRAMEGSAYRTERTPERRHLFEAYARFIASLGGIYYTAEDVGTKTSDMDAMLSQNRFVTCISPHLGGSGNPSPSTARGVFRAMQAAWRFLTGTDRLRDVRAAVQGAGNVGAPLVELLDDAGAKVWVCDVNRQAAEELASRRPAVQVVPPEEIFDLDVDVFAPCAVGDQVNVRTIPRLKARLICGAANNILGEEADAERLRERGVTFVPDYLCNRMGITNCCDEWQGYLEEDVQLAAERVYPDTLRVLKHARNLVITTTSAADDLADIAASELHPLIGHRGRRLIDHLRASNWHGARRPWRAAGEAPLFQPALDEPPIRLSWQRRELFRGDGPALAAAPITAGSRPTLASVLPALLMDVKARALESASTERCRRLVGSDPGGLCLQLAVEQSLPFEREEIGRAEFTEVCRDRYRGNDAAIREQLHLLGVGFDPQRWLDTMSEAGAAAVRRLFHALGDAGLLGREKRLSHHCPRCATVRVASDVKPTRIARSRRYAVRFETEGGESLEALTFYPELLVGAVAVAVRAGGPQAALAGERVTNPLDGTPLPVVAVPEQTVEATFLVPAWSAQNERLAREHGIESFPPVFDEEGGISVAGRPAVARPEARRIVLGKLGEAVREEEGSWQVEAHRCRRCETIVLPVVSEELFLHLERARPALEQALASGAVEVPGRRWHRLFEESLASIEPLCISRQQWWGNELPGRPGEVLSTWFSLLAWSLQATGWPEAPSPEPVAEVFSEPDLLRRWVLPSQLVSLALTGRPAFRTVRVHGSLHVVDRKLETVEGATPEDPDEERFLYRAVHRPMRKQLGNAVEPLTLIRRFGADPLRLGTLLSLSGDAATVTLSESNLRRARRALGTLVAKIGGLAKLLADVPERAAPSLADRWILARCAAAGADAHRAYAGGCLEEAARLLVGALDDVRRWADGAARRGREAGAWGDLPGTLAGIVSHLAGAFAPICPFTFDRLREWLGERGLEGRRDTAEEAWLAGLVADLRRGRGEVEISSPDPAALTALEAEHTALEDLAGRPVTVTATPRAGTASVRGAYLVVRPGELRLPEEGSPVLDWYRSRLG